MVNIYFSIGFFSGRMNKPRVKEFLWGTLRGRFAPPLAKAKLFRSNSPGWSEAEAWESVLDTQ
jgi:hypothetical protein